MKNKVKYIKFPKAPKLVPKVSITAHFGDSNVSSFDLPYKAFKTPQLVRAEVKKRFPSVTKAFVLFPGDEFAESMTFSTKLALKVLEDKYVGPSFSKKYLAQQKRNQAAIRNRHPELAQATA